MSLKDEIEHFLFANPDTGFTASFIANELDFSYTATLRALNRLADEGTLAKRTCAYVSEYDANNGGFVIIWSWNIGKEAT